MQRIEYIDTAKGIGNKSTLIGLYLLINSLFVLKYSMRILPELSFVATGIYLLFALFLLYLLSRPFQVNKILFGFLLLLTLSVLICLQYSIDPYSLNVDRWSAIHNFLDYLVNGIYPYSAQTHLGGYGSPFPVWQLFHLPFYLVGNVGLSFVLATLLFVHSIYQSKGLQSAFMCFVLLLCSPAFIYEVMVRSDLLSNFLVCCAVINYLFIYKVSIQRNIWLIGIIGGLFLCTRLSAVIPLIILYFREFLSISSKNKILLLFITICTFVITFIPFIFWNFSILHFTEYNPFVLQSRQGHLTDFLWIIPLGIFFSMTWKGSIEYYGKMALFLFLLVVFIFVHNMYIHQNWSSLFDGFYDITYFNMSLPFIILSLSFFFAKFK